MKRFALILFFISLFVNTYSQDFDLIVKVNGDSIACRIDSITDSHIYFEMKFNSQWIHTYYNKSNIKSYNYNVIKRKSVNFESGTSKIIPYKKILSDADIGNNTIYFEADMFLFYLNYERRFPLTNKYDAAFSIGVGSALFDEDFFYSSKLLLLMGGPNHYFETGAIAFFNIEGTLVGILLGYRYQSPKGFQFRGPVMVTTSGDDDPVWGWIGFSVGYSF